MNSEIELKFIATPQAIAELVSFLSRWSCVYQHKDTLGNIYYDTPQAFLRTHDLGLRIRKQGERYEMTLKTGGKVVAGLHQRSEYNIALDKPVLALSLLPADIWPANCDIGELEKALKPIFSTDFTRETWLINYNDSEIELALDRGEIRAGERHEAISEIELELKRGEVNDLLAFGLEFGELGGLQLENRSKAARGYRLARSSAPEQDIKMECSDE